MGLTIHLSDAYDSDYFDDIHYRRKRRKNKKPGKGYDQAMRNFNGKIADKSV